MDSESIYQKRARNGTIIRTNLSDRDYKRFQDTLRHVNLRVKSILDVGCSNGEWLNYVYQKRKNIDCFGIDVAQNRVEETKKQYPFINFKTEYAENLASNNIKYDTVTCLEVLEHLENWKSVFNSLFDFAEKQVVISVPNNEKIKYTVCIKCGETTPIYGHIYSFSKHDFPNVEGWQKIVFLIRSRDNNKSMIRKCYETFKPKYPWLLVVYNLVKI